MPDLSPSLVNFNPTEPITKLIEAVRAAVGTLYEPTRIRRKADAEAYATRIAARAEGDTALIKAEDEIELQLLTARAEERTRYLEIRRQRNIDAIVDKAIDQLPASVSSDPVDEDWMVQFFNHAQDVGNEKMQQLWAKLLAGEVARPGSFSPRTLQSIRVLQPSDASLFQRFSSYLWRKGAFHLYSTATQEIMERKGLSYLDLVYLQALGLLTPRSDSVLTLTELHNSAELLYFDKLHIVKVQHGLQINCYILSDIGIELASLCDVEPDEEYRVALVEGWKSNGAEVTVTEIDESNVLTPSD